uniref:Dynein light chain n=1 Tax=Macrostomum lignano TaxID=282301 RepID=A0A1I8J939_9PLAT
MSRSELSSASTKGGAVLSSYKDQSAAQMMKDSLTERLSHDVGRSGAMTSANTEVALGFKTFSANENVPTSSTAVRTEFFARDNHQRRLRQHEAATAVRPDAALSEAGAAPPFAGIGNYLPKTMPPRLPPLEKPEWMPASVSAAVAAASATAGEADVPELTTVEPEAPRVAFDEPKPTSALPVERRTADLRPGSSTGPQKSRRLLLEEKKFDDTADRDILSNIIRLRQRLNWRTEVPRPSPLARRQMTRVLQREARVAGIDVSEFLLAPSSGTADASVQGGVVQAELTDASGGLKAGGGLHAFEETMERVQARALSRQDDGEFVYCLLESRGQRCPRYTPYNIEVVSAYEAKQSAVYWTVSASFVTRFEKLDKNNQEVSSMPTVLWLFERNLCQAIGEIRTFRQFRLWKAFKVWRCNVLAAKQQRNS